MVPVTYTINLIAGDSYDLTVDYQNEDGSVVDLTGETVTLVISKSGTILLTLTDGSGLTVTPALGRVAVHLTGTETEALEGQDPMTYKLRLTTSEVTLARGAVNTT